MHIQRVLLVNKTSGICLLVFKEKSRTLKNLFSSPQTDYQKLFKSNLSLLAEQRHQRSDLAEIKRTLTYIIKIMNHQDTMDYFSKKYGENLNETSHQTDLDEQ